MSVNITSQAISRTAEGDVDRFDVIVIGAGSAGLCQLYLLRQAGLSVRVFEQGDGVGGTWYWNRYPGCAFDTPAQTYTYSFAEEILDEWEWKNYYSYQPEAEAYLNLVADRFDLRRDIELSTKMTSATWDEATDLWNVEFEGGRRAQASFFIPAVGNFGAAFTPPFEGADRFKGQLLHTARWPKESPDLTGKRVAIIGTGASGVQLTPYAAEVAAHLTVFQRTPTYCLPQGNGPVDAELQAKWKADYSQTHKTLREKGIATKQDPRRGSDVSKEERIALYQEMWARRGYEKFVCLFWDLWVDREILAEYSEWLKGKIRERFDDPVLAEKFVPNDHLFQAKRVPLENGFYEAFNRDNVSLVDVRETPVETLTERGIKTSDQEYEFDVIVFATGFDTVTGAMTALDIHGVDGRTLKEKWDESGLSTYLGLTVSGFPNFFVTTIPALGASHPPDSERIAEWIRRCVLDMREKGYTRIEPTQGAEDAWVEHHEELGRNSIFGDAEYSWYKGSNVPGKKSRYLIYCSTIPNWMERCYAAADDGYAGFVLAGPGDDAESAKQDADALRASYPYNV